MILTGKSKDSEKSSLSNINITALLYSNKILLFYRFSIIIGKKSSKIILRIDNFKARSAKEESITKL
jgi:hypothetical protein